MFRLSLGQRECRRPEAAAQVIPSTDNRLRSLTDDMTTTMAKASVEDSKGAAGRFVSHRTDVPCFVLPG